MRKRLAVLAVLALLAIASCLVYWRWFRVPAGARTLYSGSVATTPATLPEREARLEAHGCRRLRGGELEALCVYERSGAGQGREALLVYPRGLGFGPVAVVLTRDRLLASVLGRTLQEAHSSSRGVCEYGHHAAASSPAKSGRHPQGWLSSAILPLSGLSIMSPPGW